MISSSVHTRGSYLARLLSSANTVTGFGLAIALVAIALVAGALLAGGVPRGALAADNTALDRVLGAGSGDQWTVGGEYAIEKDPQLGDVLTVPPDKSLNLTGATKYAGDRSFRGFVRFRPQGPGASFQIVFAQRELKLPDPKDPNLTITKAANLNLAISGNKPGCLVNASLSQDGAVLYEAKNYEKLDWLPNFSSTLAYKLRAVDQFMPGLPEDLRAQLEHEMAELPDLAHKWVELRVEVRKGSVRAWVDDRLLAYKVDPSVDPDGTVRIDMSSGAELARFETGPLVDPNLPAGFQPIALGGALNARALLGEATAQPESLPKAGETAMVGGVPFIFPGVNLEGHDHIDVGRSVMRAANWIGNTGTWLGFLARWVGAAERDPARIQLRVANAQFKALHLVAASDGAADSVPTVTAMFYRPGSGFPQSFAAQVPVATATSSDAKPLGITLSDGRKANLFLVTIPLDPGVLSSFGDLDIIEIELTKQVQLYRSYPDPISYSYHQSGLPSSVHVYAATLEKVPVGFEWNPVPFGHVWQSPAQPQYIATFTNQTGAAQTGKLLVATRSYDGTEETRQELAVALPATPTMQAPVPVRVTVNVPVKLFGYHDIQATFSLGDQQWTEKRSLVSLAPDTRSARWTPGRGTEFGFWSYGGGHHTPKAEHHVRLMTMAGARTCIGLPPNLPPDVQALVEKHWGRGPAPPFTVFPQPWAENEPFDPAKVEEFTKQILATWHKDYDALPAWRRPDHVGIFAEPSISSRLSAGNIPDYWGEKPYDLTPEEQSRLKIHFNTAKIAAQAVRKEFPGFKIFIPWGDPGFTWPLLRAGFPKDLIDGMGLDVPGFERIPERQLHEQSIHRLHYVKKEFEKAGIPKPDLRFIEGIFVPTEPGAVSWREQMDIYQRWTLISMAYGVTSFYSGWFAFDCTNYYGAEHYGGCGIQGKIPYCNPKPAYAAYATMTDKLNEANFDGWVETGSPTTYALRFKKPDNKGYVYALWSLRGKRPLTLTLDADTAVNVTDSMNNTKAVQSAGKQITVSTDPSVTYLTLSTPTGQVASAAVGEADHSDSKPAADAKLVADLGDGSWGFTGERDKTLEVNHWAMMHYPGKFSSAVTNDKAQGSVLTTKLEKQEQVHELMPWYNVLRPKSKLIELAGAPSKIGLWVRGASDWGRVIYVLRDAKGERWESIGYKDEFNCDDVHSWSMFNFDGWRYVTFELPGHAPWDSYRKNGTTWWRSDDGDTVVDLPLSLEAIVVEQRSHLLYVNDVQPAASDSVSFGKLYVEYETPADATPESVRLSKLRMPVPQGAADLPNPIADLSRTGVGAPTQIVKIRPPDHQYDGTRAHFDFQEVPGAKAYHLWVSGHQDGRGAMNMLPGGLANGQLVYGFRPNIKLYYWITYTDSGDKESKPSPVVEQTLLDTFKEK